MRDLKFKKFFNLFRPPELYEVMAVAWVFKPSDMSKSLAPVSFAARLLSPQLRSSPF